MNLALRLYGASTVVLLNPAHSSLPADRVAPITRTALPPALLARRLFFEASPAIRASWTETATGWAVSSFPPLRWLRRFQAEWTKNDGKPIEEWAPGPDLKDVTLRAVGVAFCVLQIGLILWVLWRTWMPGR